jgi:opacity protein-like surface antigen
MRRSLKWLLLVLALAVPSCAWAEGFADLFLGASFTQGSDVRLSLTDVSGSNISLSGAESFKTSLFAGARAGYWLDFAGLNLDVSWFRPDPNDTAVVGFIGTTPIFSVPIQADLNVVSVGINAMFRLQFFKSTDVPEGRLQPYMFAGPTLFISTLDAEATFPVLGRVSDSDTNLSIGVTAGGGVTFMLMKNVGLFAEYRFTHAHPEFELQNASLGRAQVEADLNTHHLLAGVTFRF